MFKTKFAQAWVISLVASIWFTSFVSAAEPKKAGDRGSVGDLVEFTTGMGPMLGVGNGRRAGGIRADQVVADDISEAACAGDEDTLQVA